eukprot:s1198_g10.t1
MLICRKHQKTKRNHPPSSTQRQRSQVEKHATTGAKKFLRSKHSAPLEYFGMPSYRTKRNKPCRQMPFICHLCANRLASPWQRDATRCNEATPFVANPLGKSPFGGVKNPCRAANAGKLWKL